eukprot:166844-Chlamydomonas_euryale.AAC.3
MNKGRGMVWMDMRGRDGVDGHAGKGWCGWTYGKGMVWMDIRERDGVDGHAGKGWTGGASPPPIVCTKGSHER